MNLKVGVVGAGISGLTAAYKLKKLGHNVTVFEKHHHVGGRMASESSDGFVIDTGVNILLNNYTHLQNLARELGIDKDWFPFHAQGSGGILRNGRLTSFNPQSAWDILRYQGLSLPTRLRFLWYLAKKRNAANDLDFFDLSTGTDPYLNTDAASYFKNNLSEELLTWLVDPFIRTFHFHSASKVSTKYYNALATLLISQGGFKTHGFRKNMGTLCHALALQMTTKRNTEVTSIEKTPSGVNVSGNDFSETFDEVILAATASKAKKILKNPTSAQTQLLQTVEYSSTLMCAFRIPLDITYDFEGIWVPYAESQIICCCANETRKGSKDAHDCLFVIGLHEEAAQKIMNQTDQTVLKTVADEWARLFPHYKNKMHGIYVQRWPEALPVYTPQLISTVKDFWQQGSAGHQGENNIWFCGDYMNHPWVEGSIHCGEKIAAAIHAKS